MTKISSKSTFFHKRAFPVLWFGIIGIGAAIAVWSGAFEKAPITLVGPAFLAVFGFFLMRHLVWDLADEVFDGGDYLLVRNRGVEERVPLSNIMNVSASTMVNPARITLRLAERGRFGNEIVFSPARSMTFNPFAKSAIAEDLIVRVDKARAQRVLAKARS
jgi:hypothetical protein